jgi:hypothetical protein
MENWPSIYGISYSGGTIALINDNLRFLTLFNVTSAAEKS